MQVEFTDENYRLAVNQDGTTTVVKVGEPASGT